MPINWMIALVLVAMVGCGVASTGATNASTAAVAKTARVIIKFRGNAVDPTRPEILAELARATGAVWVYSHPISGSAHVLEVRGVNEETRITEIIRVLERRQDVEYAELDRRVDIQ